MDSDAQEGVGRDLENGIWQVFFVLFCCGFGFWFGSWRDAPLLGLDQKQRSAGCFSASLS